MATFRNSQIEEILNDERRLNRTIMDRQKSHISAIGDQRAPPTSRDIKLEAIFGTSIDELKEEINKVIQLVSAFQFGRLDEKKIDRLLKLDTNNQNTENPELGANDKKESEVPPSNQGPQLEPGDTPGEDDNVVKKAQFEIDYLAPLAQDKKDIINSLEIDSIVSSKKGIPKPDAIKMAQDKKDIINALEVSSLTSSKAGKHPDVIKMIGLSKKNK
jgi:hypothetical protein